MLYWSLCDILGESGGIAELGPIRELAEYYEAVSGVRPIIVPLFVDTVGFASILN